MATLANPRFGTMDSTPPVLAEASLETHDPRGGWCRTAVYMLTGQPIGNTDNLCEIFETIRRLIFSYLLGQRSTKRSLSDLVGCFGRSCR
jgi:hypothetical protein